MNFQKTNKQNIFIEKTIINNFNIFSLYLKVIVILILFMKNFLNKTNHKKIHKKITLKKPFKMALKKPFKMALKMITLKN